MTKFVLLVLLLAIFGLMAYLLTRPAAPRMNGERYQAALQKFPGSGAEIDQGLERFATVYGNLTGPDIGDRITSLYADKFYFDDTLKTFHDSGELADYMELTGSRLATSEVKVKHVIRDGVDVYVRWHMQFETETMGREIRSSSMGMTHLRFDSSGRVVLHQDFWDSAEGLYRHLPLVGWLLHQVDRRMAP